MTFDQARVDVEDLEPFLHELPRLDREQLAVSEPHAQVFAQLRPRQVGQQHERRAGGGQIDEAFAQRQHRAALHDGKLLRADPQHPRRRRRLVEHGHADPDGARVRIPVADRLHLGAYLRE